VVSADTELSGQLSGVYPASPVTLLREGALAAVTSQVPLEEFDEVRLRDHLADMTWVEATARAHEAVLDQVREQATVIPMRMCTVYRTDGGAREMLLREADSLQDALEHLRGKSEWGVKVFAELESVDESSPAEGETSGTAYMERKRTERDRRERLLETIEEATTQIHDRLSAAASDSLVVPPQRPEASGHPGEMVLNGVYLIADEAVDAFHAEVEALQAEFGGDGLVLALTGPWPAYNFVPGTIGAAW
jgi:hypothetical protein